MSLPAEIFKTIGAVFFVRRLKLGWRWWKVIEAAATSSSNIAPHIWLNSCQNTPSSQFAIYDKKSSFIKEISCLPPHI